MSAAREGLVAAPRLPGRAAAMLRGALPWLLLLGLALALPFTRNDYWAPASTSWWGSAGNWRSATWHC
jgi:hypothetical protein